ncbi:unnamed protein product [Enterobius vermicularis]|uniref:39S ribosomal protein L46, mitochondrial n=1 Tax=Enterobius vermicularis TaxID=51028 RepID=A0A0N4VB76_ENTVE|nr:unnamed protein product [Enterobius vermicularis]
MQRSLKSVLFGFARFASQNAAASSSKPSLQWDICVSVALCRNPVIAPPMSPIEKEFSDITAEMEFEDSLLSDFELREIQDQKYAFGTGCFLYAQLDEKIAVSATVLKEDWAREGKELWETHRLGDLSLDSEKSLWRKLDRQLVLLVRQTFQRKDGYVSPWTLPQTIHKNGETLRQAAERCLSEITVGDLKARTLSNAPFSVFKCLYPKGLQRVDNQGTRGEKIFFYNSEILQRTEIEVNNEEIVEYKWVTAEEFAKTVTSRRYRKALSTLFIE